ISPLMIGFVSVQYSIALGIGLLGIAYAICAIIPGFFIPDKMYDPKSIGSMTADNKAAKSEIAG
ncbi:MAG: hypothetical protein PHN75_08905, partial [Syntrophales bacterium]|nr:hypothetical protein [Syntrophales bacterium]